MRIIFVCLFVFELYFNFRDSAFIIQDYVNNSDAIFNIGAKLTDSATAGFSSHRYLQRVEASQAEHRAKQLERGGARVVGQGGGKDGGKGEKLFQTLTCDTL